MALPGTGHHQTLRAPRPSGRKGALWLESLNSYIWENYRLLKEAMAEKAPSFPVFDLEGTYLAWIDCRAAGLGSEELEKRLISKAGVWLNAGAIYGAEGFMRINLATSREVLSEGLKRLASGLCSL